MEIFEKEYEIELRENKKYKIKFNKIKPTMVFSFMEIYHKVETQSNSDSLESLASLYDFVLENVNINLGGTWYPVKEKGRDVYYPSKIENEFDSISTIFNKFVEVVVTPFFPEDKGDRDENTDNK